VIGAFFEILIDWYLDPEPGEVGALIEDMTSLVDLLRAGTETAG
jgi:hypothetical protein